MNRMWRSCRALLAERRSPPGVGQVILTGVLILCVLSGCATEDIVVSEVAMTDQADAAVVGWTATESGREIFSSEDEEVTIKVLFNFNYRGVYEWYKVEWIAPGGIAYQVVSRRTDFASHRDFKASLKIRGKMASRLPGLWRVRVSLQGRDGAPDRELVSRLFRIAAPTGKMIAAGLTLVDAPAADQGRPLASYARIETGTPQKAAIAQLNSPPALELSDAKQPAADASSQQAALAMVQSAGVLAPLAIVGARAALAVTPAPAVPQSRVLSLPAESGIAAVSLRSTPAAPGKTPSAPRARNYPGCPPLYYQPGPGCIEQAAEE